MFVGVVYVVCSGVVVGWCGVLCVVLVVVGGCVGVCVCYVCIG